MEQSEISPEEMLELCNAIGIEDGISPRELAKRGRKRNSSSKRDTYRLKQLCHQVQMGIDDALCCVCCDPMLSELQTIDVRPGDGSSVLVAILVTEEQDPDTINLIQERVQAARELIGSSVAGVITRKRVPQIQFRVIPNPAPR